MNPENEIPWYVKEFSGLEFGDERLDNRFLQVVHRLSEKPEACIHEACFSWGEAKGAYRFFSNQRVTSDQILESHQVSTLSRIKDCSIVLAIQDTTYFNFENGQNIKGLGKISARTQGDVFGLIAHSTFCMSGEGAPLGILNQEIWSRKRYLKRKPREVTRGLAIEDKESFRWIRFLHTTKELTNPLSTQVITVADRECDIYEFLTEAQRIQAPYLIRAARNRVIQSPYEYLWQHMENQTPQGRYTIKNQGHLRNLIVKVSPIEIKTPVKRTRSKICPDRKSVLTTAILVSEPHPPKGESAIEWMLLTNLSIDSFEKTQRIIQWYTMRWNIENWHKIIKSGCQVEKCRLSDATKVAKYITTYSIIAWRLYALTHAGRLQSQISCESIVNANEWKALYVMVHKTNRLPKKPPTVEQFIRWTAQLGGFLGRARDGNPGIKAIWKGYQRLCDYTAIYNILKT